MVRWMLGAALAALLLAGCATVELRGTGDLGVVVERASGAVSIVNTSSRSVLARVTGLGDLSHASVVYSRDGRHAFVFGRDGVFGVLAHPCEHVIDPTGAGDSFSGGFLGHLDRMEAFRRAVRRAGGHLALSEGMRPKPLCTLVMPLGVGVQGLEEMAEFDLAEPPPDDFAERLAAHLPGHMELLGVERYTGRRHLAARVTAASYRLVFTVAGGGEGAETAGKPAERQTSVTEALAAGVQRFDASGEWMIEETREDKVRAVDVRKYVRHIELGPAKACGSGAESAEPDGSAVGAWCAEFTAAVTPVGTARPENVLKALAQASGLPLVSVETFRTGILLDRE